MKTNIFVLGVAAVSLGLSSQASAFDFSFNNWRSELAAYTLDSPHGYMNWNIGVSQLFDRRIAGTRDFVNQYGPGWNVNGGFQINSMWGVEAGFTQYYNSREIVPGGLFTIAKTEHYSADIAGTLRFPIFCKLSALGKLGVAFSHATKMIIPVGAAASANAVNLYWGAGFDYSITPRFDLLAMYANARGNHLTGSAGLFSIGLNVALV